jgi:molecular chaperone GrpE
MMRTSEPPHQRKPIVAAPISVLPGFAKDAGGIDGTAPERTAERDHYPDEVDMPHSVVDEAVATEAVDVATLIAENASLRDQLLRTLADAENSRQRAQRAAEDARRYAVADFARELLTVADNLQRTIAAAQRHQPEMPEDAALIEGVRATDRILQHTFEKFGIRRIDALGKRFDPNLHEAMMEVDDPSQPPGSVVRVAEDGYTIHDRLLRPARVIIARRRARSPATQPDETDTQWDGWSSRLI